MMGRWATVRYYENSDERRKRYDVSSYTLHNTSTNFSKGR